MPSLKLVFAIQPLCKEHQHYPVSRNYTVQQGFIQSFSSTLSTLPWISDQIYFSATSLLGPQKQPEALSKSLKFRYYLVEYPHGSSMPHIIASFPSLTSHMKPHCLSFLAFYTAEYSNHQRGCCSITKVPIFLDHSLMQTNIQVNKVCPS